MTGRREDPPCTIAATRAPVEVARSPVEVELAPVAAAALRTGRAGDRDRLLLHLADIRRSGRSGSYDVYVELPDGARADQCSEHLAGRISLYGPPPRGHAPPRTFEFVLDVSRLRTVIVAALVDRAHPLRVTIAPADDWSEPVTVGHVSLDAG